MGDASQELTEGDRGRHGIPRDEGRWFWYQKDMIDAYSQTKGVTLAWIKKNDRFAYGLFAGQSGREVMQAIHRNPPEKRWGLELIPADAVCKGYMDIEWLGEPDPEHQGLHEIVTAVRARCRADMGLNPLVYVCCGSRESKGKYKNSYHLVIENLHFQTNHDGAMQAFFTFDEEPMKSRIDLKVYTSYRVMRLPHNCKRDNPVPFQRISGDPLLDDFSCNHDFDIEAILPFFAANPENLPGTRLVEAPAPQAQLVVAEPALPPVRVKRRRIEARDLHPLPFPLIVIQDMLAESGDGVSTPTKSMWLQDEDAWQVQCDQGHQIRTCMIDPSLTHDANNCLIFVTKFQGMFKLKYHCTSGCLGFTILGYVYFSQEWKYTLSVPPNLNEPEPTEENEGEDPEIDPRMDPENPSINEYGLVKARFEKECFKIREPFCYGRIEKDGALCLHNHIELQHYYIDWTFWSKDEKEEMCKYPFIVKWLKDPSKREVHKVVIDPKRTAPGVYNLWTGFAAEKLPPVDPEDEEAMIAPIVRHVRDVITRGVEAHTEWVLDYLANMVQRPELRSQVAVSLYGQQGCGKGIIFEFFRQKVLGDHCSFQTSKPEVDILGRFGNGALNRVCIQIDEVKSLHEFSDRLKDIVTNPTLNYEKKGKDTIVVANLTNLILTSNNANALTVSPDDRRYVLFHCDPVYKGDPAYFQELGIQLARPETARAFYQHLMLRDLSKYPQSFQFNRPITDYYKEVQRNSIPVLSRFISALINRNPVPEKLMGRYFYNEYTTFHAAGNYKYLMAESAFGREVGKIRGITRHRIQPGTSWVFDPKQIKQYLRDMNEYDEDAEP